MRFYPVIIMELLLFIGGQASGKSTFYHQRFRDTHLRINLDMLRTRHREAILLKAQFVRETAIGGGQY